jgi:hypothetical protein
MRKSIWIACVVVLAVCLLLVFKTKQHQRSALPEQGEALTNQPSQPERQKIVENHQAPNTSQPPSLPPPAMPIVQVLATTNSVGAKRLALWQAPIEFYGKVVDENSNAVAGAQVTFHWTEIPTELGNRTSSTASDADGLFSLHGQHGPDLIVTVSKEGYYVPHRGQWGFHYALSSDILSPDPHNPVVFVLRKKGRGESLITSSFPSGMGQIAQLHHDGTPVELDLFNGTQVPAGSGQLKLEFWRAITNQSANIFDWKCRLTVPGGGLVETPEEFAFQAPEGGYQSPVVIDMPVTNENWQGEIRSKYYLQLPDGKYGRIDFYFLPYNGVFTVQSAINPTGSRNLEPQ